MKKKNQYQPNGKSKKTRDYGHYSSISNPLSLEKVSNRMMRRLEKKK